MEPIIVPPFAPTLIESTRAIGYSLETAVADIIDNSIAAYATKVDIFFFPVDGEYIAFLDNGAGMNEEEINTAMQYGSKSPLEKRDSNDLGRFGLGLKTASLSQCKSLTVISKQESQLFGRRWDVDYVAETGDWTLLILDNEDMESCPHIAELLNYETGTLVIWQNLDRLKAGELDFEQALGRKMDAVKQHLSLVFHRYLAGETGLKKLRLTINGQIVEPVDPFMTGKSNQAIDDEVLLVHGEKIRVRPYILPHTSKMTAEELEKAGGKEGLRRQQGFYIYRNKRLLVWGTWFRMMRQGEMSKLVRIRVDIPNALDDLWTLDIKKSAALPPAEVRNSLRNIIDRMAEKSKRTWTTRGKKEVDDDYIHIWNRMKTRTGGYLYEINREYPLIAELLSSSDCSGRLESVLKQIERNIPLNSLFIDLTNDAKIDNDSELDLKEVLESIKEILSNAEPAIREQLLNNLIKCEPFSNYSNEIVQAYNKGNLS